VGRKKEMRPMKRSGPGTKNIVDLCREKGLSTWVFPVEVGCRGFLDQSVWKTL